jgi:hypothetical protein
MKSDSNLHHGSTLHAQLEHSQACSNAMSTTSAIIITTTSAIIITVTKTALTYLVLSATGQVTRAPMAEHEYNSILAAISRLEHKMDSMQTKQAAANEHLRSQVQHAFAKVETQLDQHSLAIGGLQRDCKSTDQALSAQDQRVAALEQEVRVLRSQMDKGQEERRQWAQQGQDQQRLPQQLALVSAAQQACAMAQGQNDAWRSLKAAQRCLILPGSLSTTVSAAQLAAWLQLEEAQIASFDVRPLKKGRAVEITFSHVAAALTAAKQRGAGSLPPGATLQPMRSRMDRRVRALFYRLTGQAQAVSASCPALAGYRLQLYGDRILILTVDQLRQGSKTAAARRLWGSAPVYPIFHHLPGGDF